MRRSFAVAMLRSGTSSDKYKRMAASTRFALLRSHRRAIVARRMFAPLDIDEDVISKKRHVKPVFVS
jgi:hypothetical protein